jgi:uncharacterized lipoprotein YmbA
MKARFVMAMLLLMAITSCSSYRTEIDTRPAYSKPSYTPHYFRNRDVEVVWQTERSGQEVRLSGTVTNHRNAFMRDLMLKTRLLNEISRDLTKETVTNCTASSQCLKVVPFHITLQIPNGTTPKRLHINYAYWVAEEPSSARGYVALKDFPHFGVIDVLL